MLDIAHQSVYQPEQQLNAKFDCNRATSLGCRNYLLEMFPNIVRDERGMFSDTRFEMMDNCYE